MAMVIVIDKNTSKKELERKLKEIGATKVLDAKKFAGKINWGEDALRFQKRMRDEWQ